jgi:hypothetical protein
MSLIPEDENMTSWRKWQWPQHMRWPTKLFLTKTITHTSSEIWWISTFVRFASLCKRRFRFSRVGQQYFVLKKNITTDNILWPFLCHNLLHYRLSLPVFVCRNPYYLGSQALRIRDLDKSVIMGNLYVDKACHMIACQPYQTRPYHTTYQ